MFGLGRRIKRAGPGQYDIKLPDVERDLLRSLPGQLRELLAEDDPSLGRLFPPAYPDDPERDAEYRRLMRDDLIAGRMATLEILEETVDATRVSEEQLTAWLGALNDLRLVLGTRLDVDEDMDPPPDDDPSAGAFAVYSYLGWLQEQVVEALDPSA